MKNLYKWLGITTTFLFVGISVYAAEVSQIIPAVDPGLTLKRLQNAAPEPFAPSTPHIKKIPDQYPKVDSADEKIKFKLTSVTFKGNTAFSSADLEAIFKPSYNKTISLATFKVVVGEVTKKYRSAGFILSRAFLPAQTIRQGHVQVQIIEGFISHVEVTGKPGSVSTVLEKYATPVLASRPLQLSVLERSMLLMNDLPGASVKAVITPSETIPASADLSLVSDQKRVSAYASYDNYGTRYLGPQEAGGGVTFNSYLFPGASDSFRYMTVAQTNQLEYLEYTHTHPLGSHGTKLTFGGNYANTRPAFILSGLNVVGRSQLYYLDVSHPWIRSRSKNFFVHAAANYQNVSSTIIGVPFYADFLRSLVIGAEFNAIDHWQGVNDVKIDYERGFAILGANQHLLQSRPKGVPKYNTINIGLSRIQALPWQLTFLASMRGQYSCEPLLATEQFAYGGADYGRGYDPSEIVGDDGIGSKFELRRDSNYGIRWLAVVQYYLFYDAGVIWNRDGLNLPAKQSATSTGLGARMTFIPQLSGNLFYAKPLTHSIATQVAMGKDPLKPRIFFQLIFSV